MVGDSTLPQTALLVPQWPARNFLQQLDCFKADRNILQNLSIQYLVCSVQSPRLLTGRMQMSAKKLADLTRKELRTEMLKSTLVVLAFCICAIGIFYLIPFDGMTTNSQAVLRIVLGIALLILVIALLFRRIMTAPIPQLKAMEALVVVLVKFICLFAGTYLAISHMNSDAFTEPLTHTSSLYFTIVTFGTVGYGDLTANSDFARILVSIQIILDFIFIAAIIRAFVAVAQLSLQKSQAE